MCGLTLCAPAQILRTEIQWQEKRTILGCFLWLFVASFSWQYLGGLFLFLFVFTYMIVLRAIFTGIAENLSMLRVQLSLFQEGLAGRIQGDSAQIALIQVGVPQARMLPQQPAPAHGCLYLAEHVHAHHAHVSDKLARARFTGRSFL